MDTFWNVMLISAMTCVILLAVEILATRLYGLWLMIRGRRRAKASMTMTVTSVAGFAVGDTIDMRARSDRRSESLTLRIVAIPDGHTLVMEPK